MPYKLLDLFCCAGGAGMGYARAGFEVVGVDIEDQPRYPFQFFRADALEFLAKHGSEFDVIHASPPCQRYSEATAMNRRGDHPDLIGPTRDLLQAIGRPYVIENVENARHHLIDPLKLCGSMFGLPFQRHRYFEISPKVLTLLPPCAHTSGYVDACIDGTWRQVRTPVLVTGGGDGKRASRKNHRPRQPVAEIRWAMGIDWMVQSELTEAIPPAYTEYLGGKLLEIINALRQETLPRKLG